MGYIITNDAYYLGGSFPNFKPVSRIDDASHWESLEKANNALKTIPKVLRDRGYYAKDLEDDILTSSDAVVETETETETDERRLTFDTPPLTSCGIPEVEQAIQELNIMVKCSASLKDFVNHCRDEVNKEDAIQMDLLHKIEFVSGSSGKGLSMYSELAKCRKRRRAYKDLLEIVENIASHSSTAISANYIDEKLESLSHRCYQPRSKEVSFE